MTIPVPLAYPPTALRNVAAGLVVGNPVGSSGTRAKALTSAELKAIVEASGVSYLPLSGGTLTGELVSNSRINASTFGPTAAGTITTYDTTNYHAFNRLGSQVCVINDSGIWVRTTEGRITLGSTGNCLLYGGTPNVLEQRNGLTAQCFDLFETFTSSTNNGKLRFKATSSGHQIGSARASSGSNRAVEIGHFNSSDAFTSAVSIATTGVVTLSSDLVLPFSARLFCSNGSTNGNYLMSGNTVVFASSTGAQGGWNAGGMYARRLFIDYDNADICLARASASNLGIYAADGSTPAAVTCGAIVSNSNITFVPSSSRTLSTNGQFSIEMTSNTAGNLVYRGSDGTTRRMALTFS